MEKNRYAEEEGQVKCTYRNTTVYIPRQLFARLVLDAPLPEKRYCRYKDGAELFSMCERTFYTIAHEARATYKRDKSVLVKISDVDDYISMYRE